VAGADDAARKWAMRARARSTNDAIEHKKW
jgi:hypothetical protein